MNFFSSCLVRPVLLRREANKQLAIDSPQHWPTDHTEPQHWTFCQYFEGHSCTITVWKLTAFILETVSPKTVTLRKPQSNVKFSTEIYMVHDIICFKSLSYITTIYITAFQEERFLKLLTLTGQKLHAHGLFL